MGKRKEGDENSEKTICTGQDLREFEKIVKDCMWCLPEGEERKCVRADGEDNN